MSKIHFEESINKEITLIGIARDAKGGAILLVDEIPVYLKGLSSWDPPLFGNVVKVKGILRDEKIIPDPSIDENGAISQGAIGTQFVLESFKII